jgi:hypothetical protein
MKWKLANTALPIVLIISFGLSFQYFRKKRYGK